MFLRKHVTLSMMESTGLSLLSLIGTKLFQKTVALHSLVWTLSIGHSINGKSNTMCFCFTLPEFSSYMFLKFRYFDSVSFLLYEDLSCI